ncbi:MAG TPA: zinc metalloprotease HtpX [Gammaproteobacteria bacterium]|nr:zinc metalloprotease HtpX [Gammaproteobacteria bacterium]
MDNERLETHKLMNMLQSVILMAAMAGLLGMIGWLVGGGTGIFMALVITVFSILFSPSLSPRLVLRMYRARPFNQYTAPALYFTVQQLSQRAGLPAPPSLYYIPSTIINAFTIGIGNNAALVMTDGLLRSLNPRELNAVLAHEICHIRNNDTWFMGLADLFSRMTHAFSLMGQILLLINLPLYIYTDMSISWLTVLLLIFAPAISVLIQLALSRTREYDADLDGARISGDPEGLAMALAKIEQYQGGIFERIFFPGKGMPDQQSILRTHPPTEERIRRLRELVPQRVAGGYSELNPLQDHFPEITQRPRWHINGLWY